MSVVIKDHLCRYDWLCAREADNGIDNGNYHANLQDNTNAAYHSVPPPPPCADMLYKLLILCNKYDGYTLQKLWTRWMSVVFNLPWHQYCQHMPFSAPLECCHSMHKASCNVRMGQGSLTQRAEYLPFLQERDNLLLITTKVYVKVAYQISCYPCNWILRVLECLALYCNLLHIEVWKQQCPGVAKSVTEFMCRQIECWFKNVPSQLWYHDQQHVPLLICFKEDPPVTAPSCPARASNLCNKIDHDTCQEGCPDYAEWDRVGDSCSSLICNGRRL